LKLKYMLIALVVANLAQGVEAQKQESIDQVGLTAGSTELACYKHDSKSSSSHNDFGFIAINSPLPNSRAFYSLHRVGAVRSGTQGLPELAGFMGKKRFFKDQPINTPVSLVYVLQPEEGLFITGLGYFLYFREYLSLHKTVDVSFDLPISLNPIMYIENIFSRQYAYGMNLIPQASIRFQNVSLWTGLNLQQLWSYPGGDKYSIISFHTAFAFNYRTVD